MAINPQALENFNLSVHGSLNWCEQFTGGWSSFDVENPGLNLEAAEKVKSWSFDYGKGLLLDGPDGSGKTRIMKALILSNASTSNTMEYVKGDDFADRIEDPNWVEHYLKPHVLVLDDMDLAMFTFDENVFHDLLKKRHSAGVLVFMTFKNYEAVLDNLPKSNDLKKALISYMDIINMREVVGKRTRLNQT